MALSFFGRRRDDPWDLFTDPLPLPSSLMRTAFPFPGHRSFARDVAAVANPQVDWKETDDFHIFMANLPGLSKQDVKVQVEDGNVLMISGERQHEESRSGSRWHRVQRSHASFLRRFRLPDNAKVEEVNATMENGVLTVTVPKKLSVSQKTAVPTVNVYN